MWYMYMYMHVYSELGCTMWQRGLARVLQYVAQIAAGVL